MRASPEDDSRRRRSLIPPVIQWTLASFAVQRGVKFPCAPWSRLRRCDTHRKTHIHYLYIQMNAFHLLTFPNQALMNIFRSITHNPSVQTFDALWTQTMSCAVRRYPASVFMWNRLWSQLGLWGLEADGRRGRFVAARAHNKSRVCGLKLYKGSRSKCYAVYMHS